MGGGGGCCIITPVAFRRCAARASSRGVSSGGGAPATPPLPVRGAFRAAAPRRGRRAGATPCAAPGCAHQLLSSWGEGRRRAPALARQPRRGEGRSLALLPAAAPRGGAAAIRAHAPAHARGMSDSRRVWKQREKLKRQPAYHRLCGLDVAAGARGAGPCFCRRVARTLLVRCGAGAHCRRGTVACRDCRVAHRDHPAEWLPRRELCVRLQQPAARRNPVRHDVLPTAPRVPQAAELQVQSRCSSTALRFGDTLIRSSPCPLTCCFPRVCVACGSEVAKVHWCSGSIAGALLRGYELPWHDKGVRKALGVEPHAVQYVTRRAPTRARPSRLSLPTSLNGNALGTPTGFLI